MNDEQLLQLAERAQYDPDAVDELCQSRDSVARLAALALDGREVRRMFRYPVEREKLEEEYYHLRGRAKQTKKQKARIEEIRSQFEEMDNKRTGSPRDRLLLEIIDEYMAGRASLKGRLADIEITEETKTILADMWANIPLGNVEPDEDTRNKLVEVWEQIKQDNP